MKIIKTLAFASTVIATTTLSASGAVLNSNDAQAHNCLAKAVYYEARSEPLAGLFAVGHVVINRYRSSQYPNSICSVVYQQNTKGRGCQFSWACRPHAKPHGVLWSRSQHVATQILSGKSQDVSLGATNFHSRQANVRYNKKHYQRTVVIGNHIFWKPKTQLNDYKF